MGEAVRGARCVRRRPGAFSIPRSISRGVDLSSGSLLALWINNLLVNFPTRLVQDGDHEGKVSVLKGRRQFLAVLDAFGVSCKETLKAIECARGHIEEVHHQHFAIERATLRRRVFTSGRINR